MNAKYLALVALVIIGGIIYNVKTTKTAKPVEVTSTQPQTAPTKKEHKWIIPQIEITPPKLELFPEKLKPFYSYVDGLEVAKKHNKKVFMVFHADWCYWCKRLEHDTLETQEIKDALKDYVIIKVDGSNEQSIVKKYNVNSFPAYFIIDANGTATKSGTGYKKPAEFKNWLAGYWSENRVIFRRFF